MRQFGRRGFVAGSLAAGSVIPLHRASSAESRLLDSSSGGDAVTPRVASFSVGERYAHGDFYAVYGVHGMLEPWNVLDRLSDELKREAKCDQSDDGCPVSARTENEQRQWGMRVGNRFVEMYEALERATAQEQCAKSVDLAVITVELASHFTLAITDVLSSALRRRGTFVILATVCVDGPPMNEAPPACQVDALTQSLGDARFLLRPYCDGAAQDWASLLMTTQHINFVVSYTVAGLGRHPLALRQFSSALGGIRNGWFGFSDTCSWDEVSGALDSALTRAGRTARKSPTLAETRFIRVEHGPNVPRDRLLRQMHEFLGTDAATVAFQPFQAHHWALREGLDVISVDVFGDGEPFARS
jgi:hypothetical protein